MTVISSTVSAAVPRSVLTVAERGGADPRELMAEAKLSSWMLADGLIRVPVRRALRLWKVAAHALDDPHLALRVSAAYRPGWLGLIDYISLNAGSLGAALRERGRYMYLLTNNTGLESAMTGRDFTLRYHPIRAADWPASEPPIAGLGSLLPLARLATGRRVCPRRVTFRHRAPRRYREYIEFFGTRAIEFGAERDTLSFDPRIIDLPIPGADPRLAAILRQYAESLRDADAVTDLRDRIRTIMARALDKNVTPTRAEVGARLAISPRTLQRRLYEADTTWRAELEAVRQDKALRLLQSGNLTMAAVAARIGYSDARSLRRALHRWNRSG